MSTNSVVILSEVGAIIRGERHYDVKVQLSEDTGTVAIRQDDDLVEMSVDEAEALFLVLDTMLHTNEE